MGEYPDGHTKFGYMARHGGGVGDKRRRSQGSEDLARYRDAGKGGDIDQWYFLEWFVAFWANTD